MQEGQEQFAATPGVAAKKGEEPVTTEAAIVAPTAGGRVGDRLVDPKAPKTMMKVSQGCLSCVFSSCRFVLIMNTYAGYTVPSFRGRGLSRG